MVTTSHEPGLAEHVTPPQNTINNQESLVTTMGPASRDDMRPFTTVNYKQQRANKMKQRKIRQLMRTQENNPSDEIYPKFFTIRFPKLNIEKDVNLIAIDKDLKAKIGIPTMIKKQNKETLLVKVKSENQGNLLQQIQELAQQKVAVESHKSLNQSKGTVFSEALSNSTQEEILEALKNQHVLKVERLKAKIRGELQDTHRYVFTFNKPDLPASIKITDWHHELISLYIPKPMRCANCQRLGHTRKHCRRQVPVCARCAQEGHQAQGCLNDPKCANCGEPHRSYDTKRPLFTFKSEILATQIKNKMSYAEAEDEVKGTLYGGG